MDRRTMAGLITAPLSEGGFGLALDQHGGTTLARIFSDDMIVREHQLTVHTLDGTRQAVLKQAAP